MTAKLLLQILNNYLDIIMLIATFLINSLKVILINYYWVKIIKKSFIVFH